MDDQKFLSAAFIAVVIAAMLFLFAWQYGSKGVEEIRDGVRSLKKSVEMVSPN